MDESGELELWRRARANDGEAFGELFDLHRDRIYRRALGLLRRQHDAEDITAAAFFELWRKRRAITPVRGSVLPWLLVATVNLSRNHRRSTMRFERFLRSSPRTEVVDGPDFEVIETSDRLETSLARLSPTDSALLVLTALEDIPLAQAAQALGLKPATARVRLHRARARLRLDLHDLNPFPRNAEGTH
jgi:RNA polymerase sigma factor (sigma-70 family)